MGFITEGRRASFFSELNRKGRIENHEMEVRTKDGVLRYGLFNAVMMSLGNEKYLLTVMTDITERKQAEEAVRASREQLDFLIRNTTDYVCRYSDTGMMLFGSGALYSMTGYKPEEIIGSSGFNRMHPDDRSQVRAALKEAVETGAQQNVEFRADCKGGGHKWLELSGKAVQNDETGQKEIVAVVRDITERKRAEEALRASDDKIRAIFQSIPDHMSVMDKELNIVWANETATRMFGSDIIGRKCYEAYHRRKEPCEPYPCLTLKAFKDGGVHEHDIDVIDQAGKTIHFHCTANVASKDKDGNPIRVLEISRDITERKLAEAQLWENQERLRLALQAGRQGFVDWDVQNDHLYYSDIHFKILGYSRDELEPQLRSWNKLIHPQDKTAVIRALKDHLDGINDHYEATYRLKVKSGGWRWFRCHAEVVTRDDNGSPLRMIGTITDATSEKEIEQELELRVEERTAELVEVNAALKVLLKQREQDKTDTEETMAANLKLTVHPYLHKLKTSHLNDQHKTWVSLIDENLNKVSSPFIKNLNSKYSVLTPKELQVAEHIRSGKTSKEIADMMNLSPRTVDVFRHSLRKKLGLNNKKINLQSLLSSL
jgi:PAS domain S-box-containing protein